MTDKDRKSGKNPKQSGYQHSVGGSDSTWLKWRRRIYEVIEVGRGEDKISRIVDNFLIALIILNILAFALETVPSINKEYGQALYVFEIFSVFIFTIEYVLRLWTAVEVPFLKRLTPGKARMRFAMRPYLIIDLLAILPFYLSFLLPIDLRFLRIFRLFRFLKIARYSPALHTLVRVLVNERKALTGALLLVMAALLCASTGMYYIERHHNPEHFGSIPQAAWWAMATLTTVGYGDAYPTSAGGQIFGSLVMICGLMVLALPIAIIATGFSQEVSRRDFVVTWSLVARIPILAELEANEVAALMKYLHAHNFPEHWEIIHAGNESEAIYFVAAGQVLRKTEDGDEVLRTGDFFGEVDMLGNTKHRYPYSTLTQCKLLKLHKEDYSQLCHSHPEICQHIQKIADQRRKQFEERANAAKA